MVVHRICSNTWLYNFRGRYNFLRNSLLVLDVPSTNTVQTLRLSLLLRQNPRIEENLSSIFWQEKVSWDNMFVKLVPNLIDPGFILELIGLSFR